MAAEVDSGAQPDIATGKNGGPKWRRLATVSNAYYAECADNGCSAGALPIRGPGSAQSRCNNADHRIRHQNRVT
eukprot:1777506-Pleurochrysis_carterae.AAC.2